MLLGGVRGALASLVVVAVAVTTVTVPAAAQKGPKKGPKASPLPSPSPSPWGAPRRDPDGTKRWHLGQDVFCDPGAPVLAAERGRIAFGRDRLGGFVARLHRDRGGYLPCLTLRVVPDSLAAGCHPDQPPNT